MRPLADWPLAARRGLVGVFTDIDDTLTTHGSITPDALQALADLQAAGLYVIPITGRPIGWCRPLAQGDAAQGLAPWPVHAFVAENGGAALVPHPQPPHPLNLSIYPQDAAVRASNRTRMQAIAARVLAQVPGVQLARDSRGRETDLAFDHGEYASLSSTHIAQVLAIMQHEGMHTTVSSIHIHGCFGDVNKWVGAQWIVRELLQRDLAQEMDRWAFVGDSGNDQAMFEHFPHSIGVANIARFAPQMQHLPCHVAPSARGAGFAEVARAILAARKP